MSRVRVAGLLLVACEVLAGVGGGAARVMREGSEGAPAQGWLGWENPQDRRWAGLMGVWVKGNQEWTATDVSVSPGQVVQIETSGSIYVGSRHESIRPEGIEPEQDCDTRTNPPNQRGDDGVNSFRCGAMLGRLGKSGPIFEVGRGVTCQANQKRRNISGSELCGAGEEHRGMGREYFCWRFDAGRTGARVGAGAAGGRVDGFGYAGSGRRRRGV